MRLRVLLKKTTAFLLCVSTLCTLLMACKREDTGMLSETSAPAGTEQSAPVNTEGTSSVPKQYFDIGFADYAEYVSFFQENTAEEILAESPYSVSDAMVAYIQEIQRDPQALLIPCYQGTPVELRKQEGYDGIALLDHELYYFVWSWFYTNIDGENLVVCLSKLSEENASLASTMSCSEFIATIAPDAPNIHNYQEKTDYKAVYEDTLMIDGTATSVLIRCTKSDEQYFSFVMKDHLVLIKASGDADTATWLRNFSLESVR